MISRTTNIDLADFDVQVKAARHSLSTGYYATARAELRGAMLAVNAAERQSRMVTMIIDLRPLDRAIESAIQDGYYNE